MEPVKLQEKLNDNAEKRLDKLITEFKDSIGECALKKALEKIEVIAYNESGKEKKVSLMQYLSYDWQDFTKTVKKVLLPDFIEKETNDFISKVEALQEQLDEIKGNLPS